MLAIRGAHVIYRRSDLVRSSASSRAGQVDREEALGTGVRSGAAQMKFGASSMLPAPRYRVPPADMDKAAAFGRSFRRVLDAVIEIAGALVASRRLASPIRR
jgi:hypothetical protein